MRVFRFTIISLVALLLGVMFLPYNINDALESGLIAPDRYLGPADIAIVLGAGLKPDGTLTQIADERVRAAVAYHNEYKLPLLFTGGETRSGVEADRMHASAAQMGYEGERLLERASTSTYENALFSDRLLDERGAEEVVVITSPYHSKRAKKTFASLMPERQVEVYYPQSSVLGSDHPIDRIKALRSLLREYAANVWYKGRHKI